METTERNFQVKTGITLLLLLTEWLLLQVDGLKVVNEMLARINAMIGSRLEKSNLLKS